MANKDIRARIQTRIDTSENWKTNNPVLLAGELGVESDTKLIKVGDGTTSWTSLPYLQYLPLSGGQLTGALKISKGSDNGIQDSEGNNLFYMSSDYVLNIRNEAYDDINLGSVGEIKIGGSKITSDINVIGRSFKYNDKSVAVKDDIPKTLNNKTLVANGNTTIYGTDIALASDNVGNLTDAISNANTQINNLTTVVNGKADLESENTFNELQTFNKGILVNGNISDGINNILVSEILKSNITNTFSEEQIFNDYIILKDGYGIKSRLSTGALKNIIFKDVSGSSIIIGDTSVDIITNGKSFLPMTNIDLGSTALKWRNVYLSGNLNDGTNSIALSNIFTTNTEQDINVSKGFNALTRFTSINILGNKSDGTKIRRGSISGENGDNGLLNFDISNGLRISSLSNSSSSWILKITSDGSLEFSKE